MTATEQELREYFPVWDALNSEQHQQLCQHTTVRHVNADTVLHKGDEDCVGLFLIKSGQLRVYMISETGKEITMYRLFEYDMCVFSASCVISQNLKLDAYVQAEKDTELLIVPPNVYKELLETSLAAANHANKVMGERLSAMMWLLDNILFKTFDVRLADFLMDQYTIEETPELSITHEKIAQHLGTAREVVSRMLKYFEAEGMVSLSRGKITIVNVNALRQLAMSKD